MCACEIHLRQKAGFVCFLANKPVQQIRFDIKEYKKMKKITIFFKFNAFQPGRKKNRLLVHIIFSSSFSPLLPPNTAATSPTPSLRDHR